MPKPVVRRPGSMPRMRMAFIDVRAERRAAPKPARIPSGDRPTYSLGEGSSSQAEVPAHGMEEHRGGETQRRDSVEQPDRPGHRRLAAPAAHAGVALDAAHHELAECAAAAGD